MEYGKLIWFCAMFYLQVQLSSECRCNKVSIGRERTARDTLSKFNITFDCGEVVNQSTSTNLDNIKMKLKEEGIFVAEDKTLSDQDRKELDMLFDAVEALIISQKKQTSNDQDQVLSLRLVEEVVKSQLKKGQLSKTLADKFHWDKM